jgi:integrase/recombinase XerD
MGELGLVELNAMDDPKWNTLKRFALEAMPALNSRRAYSIALDHFYQWYFSEHRAPFSKAIVQEYRTSLEKSGYAPSTIALHLSAIRRLATEAADNGLMDVQIAAGVCRARGPRRLGRRIGNWLGAQESAALINSTGAATVKGIRDRAILAIGIACGLRRGEIATLTMDHLQMREGRWVVVDLVGKYGRIRSVPMAHWVKQFIDEWCALVKITSGNVFRALDKVGRLKRDSLSGQAVYEAVKTHAARLGLRVSPHDLRRTFASLAHAADARLEQIQYSLGHGSITTTELYLGLRQDLVDSPSDRIRLPL